jgi:hypothetical protein
MADELITGLQRDFRAELERFYAALRLAPPYHSVEKAVAALGAALDAIDPVERRRQADDPAWRRGVFARAFVAGGLPLKHRGPVLGLIRDGQAATLAADFTDFLQAYEQGR